MSTTIPQPVPKNLREQMIQRLETAPEEDVIFVHEALLHAEKLKLLDDISAGAENEQASGRWERLPELLREVRSRLRRE